MPCEAQRGIARCTSVVEVEAKKKKDEKDPKHKDSGLTTYGYQRQFRPLQSRTRWSSPAAWRLRRRPATLIQSQSPCLRAGDTPRFAAAMPWDRSGSLHCACHPAPACLAHTVLPQPVAPWCDSKHSVLPPFLGQKKNCERKKNITCGVFPAGFTDFMRTKKKNKN